MKIVDCTTFVVGNPEPTVGGRYFLFVKLVTDGGVVGWGEVYSTTFSPHTTAALVEEVVARHVAGRDPHQIEAIARDVYGRGYTGRPDTVLMGVFSGIEIALWDIIGKEAGRPVYDLIGGRVHETLRTYTYLYEKPDDPTDVFHDPELAAARAAEYAALGHTAVKFDPAGKYSTLDPRQPSLEALDRCERYTAAIREAVGSRVDLLFGTHGQFTPAGAIRLARRLEPYDPLWLEEPTPPEHPHQMATVARATTIPIATGERLTTRHEFHTVLTTGAASILQPNLGRAGGILEGKKITTLAETHHAQIAPHTYCGPIIGTANIHLATASPTFLLLEGIKQWDGFHATILKTPLTWHNGHIHPPTTPGLGVELDEEVALAHPYDEEDLHLTPAPGPVVDG